MINLRISPVVRMCSLNRVNLDLFKSHFLLYQSIEIKRAVGNGEGNGEGEGERKGKESVCPFLSPSPPQLLLYSPAAPFTFRVFVSVD